MRSVDNLRTAGWQSYDSQHKSANPFCRTMQNPYPKKLVVLQVFARIILLHRLRRQSKLELGFVCECTGVGTRFLAQQPIFNQMSPGHRSGEFGGPAELRHRDSMNKVCEPSSCPDSEAPCFETFLVCSFDEESFWLTRRMPSHTYCGDRDWVILQTKAKQDNAELRGLLRRVLCLSTRSRHRTTW